MEPFVDNLKTIILGWNTVVLQNTLLELIIIGTLTVLCFWFLLMWYYHTKIAKIKQRNQTTVTAIELEKSGVDSTLAATAQQLLQTEQMLVDKQQAIEQLEIAQQAAKAQVDRGLEQDNQIAVALAVLQNNFFPQTPATPLFGEGSGSAWQGYKNAVDELTSRLKTYAQDQLVLQQEKIKAESLVAEKSLMIGQLQQQIATQTGQMTLVGNAIDAQPLVYTPVPQADLPSEVVVVPAISESNDLGMGTIMQQVETVTDNVASAFEVVPQAAIAPSNVFSSAVVLPEVAVDKPADAFKSVFQVEEDASVKVNNDEVAFKSIFNRMIRQQSVLIHLD